MINSIVEFHIKVIGILEETQALSYFTRAIVLQEQAVESIRKVLLEASQLKVEAIKLDDQNIANAVLAFESMLKARCHELQMWIALKENKPFDSWCHLVNSQTYASLAQVAHEVSETLGTEASMNRLRLIENIVFPPQTYLSIGMTVIESECSICESEFGTCDHLKGMPYMGEFCFRVIKKAQPIEVSFVDEPANKCCIVRSIKSGSDWIDVMTLLKVEDSQLDGEKKRGQEPF